MPKAGQPHIDRAVTLHFQGDWGQANLHRICGWLAQEFNDRGGPGSRTAIWTGRGGTDAVDAIVKHDVDLSMVVPSYVGYSAVAGVGMFDGTPHPELRALGVMPQDDRLVFAVGAEHGVRTFEDLRDEEGAAQDRDVSERRGEHGRLRGEPCDGRPRHLTRRVPRVGWQLHGGRAPVPAAPLVPRRPRRRGVPRGDHDAAVAGGRRRPRDELHPDGGRCAHGCSSRSCTGREGSCAADTSPAATTTW